MAARKKDFRHFGRVRHPARKLLRRALLFIAIFFVSYTLVSAMLISTLSIGSVSMEPTLSTSDRLFSSPLVFGPPVPFTNLRFAATRPPERGEIVVVKAPFSEDNTIQKLLEPLAAFFTLQKVKIRDGATTSWESSTFVKRVIGIPGDTVMMDNFVAFVKPQSGGEFENERIISGKTYSITLTPLPKNWADDLPLSGNMDAVMLGDNEYFVLGDNRTHSHDSRFYGPVSGSDIVGKVMFRYWPFGRIGVP